MADYQDWKGEGVWGKTFRGFSKNAYNPYEMSLRIEEEQVDDPDPGWSSPYFQISPTTTSPSTLPVDDTLQTLRFLWFPKKKIYFPPFQLSWFSSWGSFPFLSLRLPLPCLLLSKMLVNNRTLWFGHFCNRLPGSYLVSIIYCNESTKCLNYEIQILRPRKAFRRPC